MNRIIQVTLLMLVTGLMMGCASTKTYFGDRKRDAADIFTCAVGQGAGAKVRAGPLCVGLFKHVNRAGLQNGEVFFSDSWKWRAYADKGGELRLLIIGGEVYRYLGYERGKGYDSFDLFLIPMSRDIMYQPMHYSVPYWTHFEVGVGLGYTVRVGFNPGELADFLLGWFGIDIYGDDIEMKKFRSESKNLNTTAVPAVRYRREARLRLICAVRIREMIRKLI